MTAKPKEREAATIRGRETDRYRGRMSKRKKIQRKIARQRDRPKFRR